MKKLVITFFIALISVAICCGCTVYVAQSADEAKIYVEKTQDYVEKSQPKMALKEIGLLEDFWKNNHDVLAMILHHEMLEEIENSIALMWSSLEYSDDNSDFWNESTSMVVKLENLKESEMPNWPNIM